ncbi:MAG: hypothetical protein IPO32_01310 [Crocinitomicaceae bacterium]|nr:hypothetical protein [Crocinitomicaceae bacterium]MBK9590170.1 hypothetical protein [Crocinitomicaceae bacterium]
MIRYLTLLLILVLSLGNVLRLGKLGQTDFIFWLSISLLLMTSVFIIVLTIHFIKPTQREKRIRLSDLKKDDQSLW